ncbi:MAG: CHAD domain-containing protein [Myxococcota bacterium]
MSLPSDLLDRQAKESTRWIALSLLDEAQAGSERMKRSDDDEALHDFRVAIRRLRSLARLHNRHLDDAVGKKRQRRLRNLQRMTGPSRDLEVQLEWVLRFERELDGTEREGAAWVAARFRKALKGGMDGVASAARKKFAKLSSQLRPDLEAWTVALDEPQETYRVAVAGLARAQAAELAELLDSVRSVEDQEAIHDARIAGKRLRYLVEPVRPWMGAAKKLVKELKTLQELLGDWHDMHVLLETLEGLNKKADSSAAEGIAALQREARARVQRHFEQQQRDFANTALELFVGRVEALARQLDNQDAPPLEIERKYLLSSLPQRAKEGSLSELIQGYLPGDQVRERLRKATKGDVVRRLRTIKAGRGIARIEFEEETTEDVFDAMWPLTEGARVLKRRYAVTEGDLVWEIDEFLDRDLVLAEVELPRADIVPPIPGWLAPYLVREVTGEDEYVNVNLAQ